MMDQLKRLLDDLDGRLDAAQQEFVHELHMDAMSWKPVKRLPLFVHYPAPPDAEFRPFPHSQAWRDPEKMLFNELVYAFEASICHHHLVGDDLPFAIRANLGCVVISSIFGAKVVQLEDNPPWVRPYANRDALQAVLEMDPTDFSRGICPRIVELHEFYRDTLKDYPNVRKSVQVTLPDLQGPFDNAEMLRGSALFIDMYDDPEFVRALMEQMTKAQVGFTKHLQPLIHEARDGFFHQHAAVLPGNVLIRGDSSINISAEMYRDHVAPFDESVLRQVGGGGIHFCGRGEHLIDEMFRLPSMRCLDLGQPEMNDVDGIYAKAAERKIGMDRVTVDMEEILSGSVMKRFPTGVSLVCRAESIDDARRIVEQYKAATA